MLMDWKYKLGAIRQPGWGVANMRLFPGGSLLSRNEFSERGRRQLLISRRHIRD